MIYIRRGNERGFFDHGWLKTYHTFSFADYYDPNFMGFRALRVINQDVVAPGQGFDMHFHQDMEIITYVLRGAITHRDSMGNTTVIKPGEIQCMSAGTGVKHGEYNASTTEELELLQIWIIPDEEGLTPSYQQITFPQAVPQFRLLASRDGEQDSVRIHQGVNIFRVTLTKGQAFNYELKPQRYVWLQLIRGELILQDQTMVAGDGVAIAEQDRMELVAMAESEFLLFDLN